MNPGDFLIRVLSHRGEMAVKGDGNTFGAAAEQLFLRHCKPETVATIRKDFNPWHLASSYADLGHCRIDGERVQIASPTLILLPKREPTAILSGARDDALIQKLQAECSRHGVRLQELRPSPQSQWPELMPTTIRASAETRRCLKDLAETCGVTMHDVCPGWIDLQATLSTESFMHRIWVDMRPADDVRESWFLPQRLAYSGDKKTFREVFGASSITGYALAKRRPERGPATNHLYRHAAASGLLQAIPVDGEDIRRAKWLCAREAGGHSRIMAYDRELERLAVPLIMPLPFPFGRAVTLCSGEAPVIASIADFQAGPQLHGCGPGFQVRLYSGVPTTFRAVLGEKLGADIADTTLSLIKEALCETLSRHSIQ